MTCIVQSSGVSRTPVVESCAVCSRRRYNGGGGADDRIQGSHQSGGKTPVRVEKGDPVGKYADGGGGSGKGKRKGTADTIARSIFKASRDT